MPLYKVTLTFTREGLVDYLDQNKTFNGTIEAVDPNPDATPTDVYQTPRAERPKRKSKVVETILSAMREGAVLPETLRGALASVGLSENSLSTGLAILQKGGQIQRDPADGAYFLTGREAA